MSKLVEECLLGRSNGRTQVSRVLFTARAHLNILFPLSLIRIPFVFQCCVFSPLFLVYMMTSSKLSYILFFLGFHSFWKQFRVVSSLPMIDIIGLSVGVPRDAISWYLVVMAFPVIRALFHSQPLLLLAIIHFLWFSACCNTFPWCWGFLVIMGLVHACRLAYITPVFFVSWFLRVS